MPDRRPIVFIEDDADDQEILKEVLTELRFPNVLHFFSSCAKAIEYLLTTLEKPLLIISDINLPEMSGLQLIQEIQSNKVLKKKNIPFVFLTTNPDPHTVEVAFQFQSQGYFVKPPTLSELKNMLQTIINYWRVCKVPHLIM